MTQAFNPFGKHLVTPTNSYTTGAQMDTPCLACICDWVSYILTQSIIHFSTLKLGIRKPASRSVPAWFLHVLQSNLVVVSIFITDARKHVIYNNYLVCIRLLNLFNCKFTDEKTRKQDIAGTIEPLSNHSLCSSVSWFCLTELFALHAELAWWNVLHRPLGAIRFSSVKSTESYFTPNSNKTNVTLVSEFPLSHALWGA